MVALAELAHTRSIKAHFYGGRLPRRFSPYAIAFTEALLPSIEVILLHFVSDWSTVLKNPPLPRSSFHTSCANGGGSLPRSVSLSWLSSLVSHSRNSRMISSGLCLFCLFIFLNLNVTKYSRSTWTTFPGGGLMSAFEALIILSTKQFPEYSQSFYIVS